MARNARRARERNQEEESVVDTRFAFLSLYQRPFRRIQTGHHDRYIEEAR
jgi:hypothetical protein